jgi:hypothetical protein
VTRKPLHERLLAEGPRDAFAPPPRRPRRSHLGLAAAAVAALGLVEALAFAGVASLGELGLVFSIVVALAAFAFERPDEETPDGRGSAIRDLGEALEERVIP